VQPVRAAAEEGAYRLLDCAAARKRLVRRAVGSEDSDTDNTDPQRPASSCTGQRGGKRLRREGSPDLERPPAAEKQGSVGVPQEAVSVCTSPAAAAAEAEAIYCSSMESASADDSPPPSPSRTRRPRPVLPRQRPRSCKRRCKTTSAGASAGRGTETSITQGIRTRGDFMQICKQRAAAMHKNPKCVYGPGTCRTWGNATVRQGGYTRVLNAVFSRGELVATGRDGIIKLVGYECSHTCHNNKCFWHCVIESAHNNTLRGNCGSSPTRTCICGLYPPCYSEVPAWL